MLTLTTPDGHRIYVMKSWIQVVRKPTPSEEYTSNTGAVLILSGVNQAVREDIELVTELMLKA